jgi:RNA polymerase sigma-70 factor (ECF subfamily)
MRSSQQKALPIATALAHHGLMPEPDENAWARADAFQFATTHWSIVLAAGHSSTAQSGAALEQLCRSYWQPVYAYVRRTVPNADDALDLTQEFFAELLRDRSFARANPEIGRFRSFLLGALRHFLSDQRDRAKAQKRGGHIQFIPFDTVVAESRYANDPRGGDATPEAEFDRGWALALLDRGLARLRQEYHLSGRAELFDGLKGFLTGDKPQASYAEAAASLRISAGAAKMTVTRMRQRFRAILRQEIAQTVATPEQLESELRAFVKALSRP